MSICALGFSLMGLFVKRLSATIPQFELVFFRSVINLSWVLVLLARSRQTLLPERGKRLLVFRGVAGFCGASCLFYSLSRLPLPIAMILNWCSPIFVILFSALFLHEKLPPRALLWVALGFGGVFMTLNPHPELGWTSLPIHAVGIGLFGAACGGMAYVAVRAATARVGVHGIVFYFTAISTLLSAPLAAARWNWPADPGQWFELLLLGSFATIGQLTMTQAYRFAPAGLVSAMSLMTAGFSAILGWLLLGELLQAVQWVGMGILTFAIISLTLSGKR